MTLESEKWGLTGKVDCIRRRDGMLIAYEHKRGRSARSGDNEPGAWASDLLHERRKRNITLRVHIKAVQDSRRELFIGGAIVHSLDEETKNQLEGATISSGGKAGVKIAAEALKKQIKTDLKLEAA